MSNEFNLNELKSDKYWVAESELLHIPYVMREEYTLLRQSVINEDVCGAIFRIKDICETSMKIPVIMSIIAISYYIENSSDFIIKDVEELLEEQENFKNDSVNHGKKAEVQQKFSELLLKMYGTPLSIGNWSDLINLLISNANSFELDINLKHILQKTKVLINTKVGKYQSVPNWRNKVMGHGTLGIDTNEYWIQIEDLVIALKKYFNGIAREDTLDFLYEKVHIDEAGRNLVIDGVEYPISMYVHAIDDKTLCYFDSFFSNKKSVEITDYFTAPRVLVDNEQYLKIYERCTAYKNARGQKKVRRITNSEEREKFACLNNVPKFMEPKYVISQVTEFMEKNSRGVLCLEMERGMGKSVLAHYLDGRYKKEIVTEPLNAVVRVYHISDMQLRHDNRKADFFTALEANLKAYSAGKTLEVDDEEYEDENGTNLRDVIKKGGLTAQKGFVEFLNLFRMRYEDEVGLDSVKLVYIIDGIDELNADTKCILDLIPSESVFDSLGTNEADNIYIILLSRTQKEVGLPDTARLCIEIAEKLAGKNVVRFDTNNTQYRQLLRQYINKNYGIVSPELCDRIINEAERKFLYIQPYMAMGKNVMKTCSTVTATEVAKNYIDLLIKAYYGTSKHNLYLVLSAIALFGSISIKKLCDLILFTDVTYDCIGIVNDILPLLLVKRTEGEDEYSFANEEYREYILSSFKEPISEVVSRFRISVVNWIEEAEESKKSEDFAEIWADYVSKILRIDNWIFNNQLDIVEMETYVNALLTINRMIPYTIYTRLVQDDLHIIIFRHLLKMTFSNTNNLSEKGLFCLGLDGMLNNRNTELKTFKYDVSIKWAEYCKASKKCDDLWVRLLLKHKLPLDSGGTLSLFDVYKHVIKEWHDEELVGYLTNLVDEETYLNQRSGHVAYLELLLKEVTDVHLQKKIITTLISAYKSYAKIMKDNKSRALLDDERRKEIFDILEYGKKHSDITNFEFINELIEVFKPGVIFELATKELEELSDNISVLGIDTYMEKLETVKISGVLWGKELLKAYGMSEELYVAYKRTQVEATNRLLEYITIMFKVKRYDEVTKCLHNFTCAQFIESYEREHIAFVESWLRLYAAMAEIYFSESATGLLRDLENCYHKVLSFYDEHIREIPLGIYSKIYFRKIDPTQRLSDWEKTYILKCSSFRYELKETQNIPYILSTSLCKYLQDLYDDNMQKEYCELNNLIEECNEKYFSIENVLFDKSIASWSRAIKAIMFINYWQCVRYYRSIENKDSKSKKEWEGLLRKQLSVRWNEIENSLCNISQIQHDLDKAETLKNNIVGILYFSKMLPDNIVTTDEIKSVLLSKVHELQANHSESISIIVWLDKLLEIINSKDRWFNTEYEFEINTILVPACWEENEMDCVKRVDKGADIESDEDLTMLDAEKLHDALSILSEFGNADGLN